MFNINSEDCRDSASYDSEYFNSHISGWHRATISNVTEFIRLTLGNSRHLRILDMGCGSGIYGPILRTWALYLAGMDVSRDGIEIAHKRGVYDQLEIADFGVDTPSFALERHSFDVVFSSEVIEHIEDFAMALRTARSMLRKDGVILLTTTMYYHLIFYGLVVQPTMRCWSDILKYVAGFFNSRYRKKFVMRLWDYTGGHYHGFSRRQLKQAFLNAGFRIESFQWMYVPGGIVPTGSLDDNRERFALRGPHIALIAAIARTVAHFINHVVVWLRLPSSNCMIVARAE